MVKIFGFIWHIITLVNAREVGFLYFAYFPGIMGLKRIIPEEFHYKLKCWYRLLKYPFVFAFYAGNRFVCPLCRGRFRKLLPYTAAYDKDVWKKYGIVGGGSTENAICPKCSSTYRERLLYLFLRKAGLLQKQMKLLHFAPEFMLQRRLRRISGYVSADLSSALADVKMDITDIKYPDNSFDAIICCHVLEHIEDDAKAMSELYRVLKPGGWAVLQVPISKVLDKTFEDSSVRTPFEREKMFGQDDHVRIYGLDYVRRLTRAGFKVDIKDAGLSAVEIEKFALDTNERIFFCRKLSKSR
jgi:SAM-dependent methyltransferase